MARNFDEVNDYLEVVAHSTVNSLSTYSIGWWMTRESGGEGGYGRIAQKGQDSGGTRRWRIENDNESSGWGLLFVVEYSGGQDAWSISYPDTAWHQYLITHDNSTVGTDPVWYKDGSSVGMIKRLSGSGSIVADNTELNIGSATDRGKTWDGSIAHFAIWNRILTAAEAAMLGAGFSPLFIPRGLVFYTPITGRQDPELDLIQGIDVTVSGPVYAEGPSIIMPSPSEIRRYGSGGPVQTTKTFTIDGVVQAETTKTFTIDGIVLSGTLETFTIDGIVFATNTETFTIDGIVKATQTETFTIDGLVLAETTQTFTIDGVVLAQTDKTFTIDGLVLATTTKTFTIDGVVLAETTQTFTIDGVVLVETTSTFTIDGLVLAVTTQTFTIDGVVQATQTQTFTIDGIVLATTDKTFTIDGIVFATNEEIFTIDGLVKAIQTSTFTIDGIVLVETTKTFTIDGIVLETFTDTFTIDGLVLATQTSTFTIDGIVLAETTGTFTIDGIVSGLATVTKTFTIDGIVKVEGVESTFTIDGVIQTISTRVPIGDILEEDRDGIYDPEDSVILHDELLEKLQI